jgi:hypothetical protein
VLRLSSAPIGQDKEKAPRNGGAEANEVELLKGTDWLNGRPMTMVTGSRVDRNAGWRRSTNSRDAVVNFEAADHASHIFTTEPHIKDQP